MPFEFRVVVAFEVSDGGPSDNIQDHDQGATYMGSSYLIKIH